MAPALLPTLEAVTPGAPPDTPEGEPQDRATTDVDVTPVPKPRLRTPGRRTVERAEPSGEPKRKPSAKQEQPSELDLVELYGKPIGNEVCDVRGSSADEDLEIFEVCRIVSPPPIFFRIFLFPWPWLWVHSVWLRCEEEERRAKELQKMRMVLQAFNNMRKRVRMEV